jgi:transposase
MRKRLPKPLSATTCALSRSRTEDQLDLQGLHRVRERLVHNRTEVINQIRGFLLERGITFNRGPLSLRKELPSLLEDAEQLLTPSLRRLLDHLWCEWQYLNSQIDQIAGAIDAVADSDEACRRLRKIPGVGPLVCTATVAAVGNGAAFQRGRDFAAWLGLVPKQYSTGGKAKLLGITKRGNRYLRTLFVHGARAVLLRVKYDTGGLGQWVHRLSLRAPRNKVIVAIANKLARIAWVVLSSGNEYQHPPLAVAA